MKVIDLTLKELICLINLNCKEHNLFCKKNSKKCPLKGLDCGEIRFVFEKLKDKEIDI